MTVFKAINQDAAAADLPLHTALAQQIRNNTMTTIETRNRRATRAYRIDDLPRMIGTLGWQDPTQQVRVMLPFIWVRGNPHSTTLTVGVLLDVTGNATSVGLRVEPIERMSSLRVVDYTSASVTNATEASVVTGTKSTQTLTVTLPPSRTGVYMAFLTSISVEYGSADEIQDNAGGPALGTGPPLGTYSGSFIQCDPTVGAPFQRAAAGALGNVRPDFYVGFDESGKTGWPARDVESHRQAIFFDDSATAVPGVFVYPPYDRFTGDAVADGVRLMSKTVSYVELRSIRFEEGGVPASATVKSSGLNAGQPTSVLHAGKIRADQDRQFHQNTRVYHIGGWSRADNSSNDDRLITSASGGGTLNKYHGYVTYTDAWQTIGVSQVKALDKVTPPLAQGHVVAGYEVFALFAIAGNGYASPVRGEEFTPPQYRLSVRLKTASVTGTAGVTGTEFDMGPLLANTFPVGSLKLQRSVHNPIGLLLRASHYSDPTAVLANDLLSHSMLGIYPEDVWAQGNWAIYQGRINDNDGTNYRRLDIQVKGNTTDLPDTPPFGTTAAAADTHVHLISWTVIRVETTSENIPTWGVEIGGDTE